MQTATSSNAPTKSEPCVQKSYLICTTHRTGSTLLCQGLDLSKQCGLADEYFLPNGRELAAHRGVEVDPSAGYLDFLKGLQASTATENGVFGAKIMWGHLDRLCQNIADGFGEPRDSQTDGDWLRAIFPALHCVWLRRADVVLQAISSWKAKQTKIYHKDVRHDPATPAREPEYHYQEIRKIRDRFMEQNQNWKAFFGQQDLPYLEVIYEDVSADLHGEVKRICQFLDVETPHFAGANPTLERLADDVTEQWHQQFLAEESAAGS